MPCVAFRFPRNAAEGVPYRIYHRKCYLGLNHAENRTRSGVVETAESSPESVSPDAAIESGQNFQGGCLTAYK